MSDNTIKIGPCKCGGYGQVYDEESEHVLGKCHDEVGFRYADEGTLKWIAHLQAQLEAEKSARVRAEQRALMTEQQHAYAKAAARALDEQVDKLQSALDGIAKAMHYPECWDTAAYPDLESALFQGFQCAVCAEPEIHGYPKDWATTRKQGAK